MNTSTNTPHLNGNPHPVPNTNTNTDPVKPRRLVVLVSGKMRGGKDTFADMLVEAWNDGYNVGNGIPALSRRALADKLKVDYYDILEQRVADRFNCTAEIKEKHAVQSDAYKIGFINNLKNDIEHRKGLINYGQAMKKVDQFYWCWRLLEEDGSIVVPDCRYSCEVEFFQNLQRSGVIDLFMIRIECPLEIRQQRGKVHCDDDPSECQLDDFDGWDYRVANIYDKDYLASEARCIAKKIRAALCSRELQAKMNGKAETKMETKLETTTVAKVDDDALLQNTAASICQSFGVIEEEAERTARVLVRQLRRLRTANNPVDLHNCWAYLTAYAMELRDDFKRRSDNENADELDGAFFPPVEFVVGGEHVEVPIDLLESHTIEIQTETASLRLTPCENRGTRDANKFNLATAYSRIADAYEQLLGGQNSDGESPCDCEECREDCCEDCCDCCDGCSDEDFDENDVQSLQRENARLQTNNKALSLAVTDLGRKVDTYEHGEKEAAKVERLWDVAACDDTCDDTCDGKSLYEVVRSMLGDAPRLNAASHALVESPDPVERAMEAVAVKQDAAQCTWRAFQVGDRVYHPSRRQFATVAAIEGQFLIVVEELSRLSTRWVAALCTLANTEKSDAETCATRLPVTPVVDRNGTVIKRGDWLWNTKALSILRFSHRDIGSNDLIMEGVFNPYVPWKPELSQKFDGALPSWKQGDVIRRITDNMSGTFEGFQSLGGTHPVVCVRLPDNDTALIPFFQSALERPSC